MNEPKNDNLSQIFEGLLKNPTHLIDGIREAKTSGAFVGKLLLVALAGLVIFGVTLGSFSYHEQLWAAPLKTVLGITLSTLICLPSLYIFSALTGTTLGMKELAQGMAGALALFATLLLGFIPVLWVFSQSTSSETFFGTLVLTAWLIALLFGTRFLFKMLAQSGTTNTAPLRVWIGIFLLVTLQMSTTLRPLIGRADTLLTHEKLFFLEHWQKHLGSGSDEQRPQKEPEVQKTNPPNNPTQGASKSNPFLDE